MEQGSIELYDIILIGTPNWWSSIAPPVATFLSENDLSEKPSFRFILMAEAVREESKRIFKRCAAMYRFSKGFVYKAMVEGMPTARLTVG